MGFIKHSELIAHMLSAKKHQALLLHKAKQRPLELNLSHPDLRYYTMIEETPHRADETLGGGRFAGRNQFTSQGERGGQQKNGIAGAR